MRLPKLLAATAVVGLAGASAFADTLILNDGTRLRGTLVSMNRQTVVFDEESSSARAGARRVRVALTRVDAIDFTDNGFGDDSWSSDDPGRDDGYYGNDSLGNGNLRRRTVSVPADRQWTDTGIVVRAGDTLRFDPQGVIQWGPGRQDGPAGESNSPYNRNRPLPNYAGGSLIGRVGTSSGDMFYIGGDGGTFRARTSGRLFLGINDDMLQDNSGSFRVLVEHP